jgi:hypothetical protein
MRLAGPIGCEKHSELMARVFEPSPLRFGRNTSKWSASFNDRSLCVKVFSCRKGCYRELLVEPWRQPSIYFLRCHSWESARRAGPRQLGRHRVAMSTLGQ